MKEELLEQGKGMWAPLIVGGLIGAGIALLLAPKSGKELRKDIRGLASKARDSVTETVEKGKELYTETTAKVRDSVAETVEKGKELYAETTAAVKGAVEGGKKAFIEEREHHRKAA